jgi:hypothetical protein
MRITSYGATHRPHTRLALGRPSHRGAVLTDYAADPPRRLHPKLGAQEGAREDGRRRRRRAHERPSGASKRSRRRPVAAASPTVPLVGFVAALVGRGGAVSAAMPGGARSRGAERAGGYPAGRGETDRACPRSAARRCGATTGGGDRGQTASRLLQDGRAPSSIKPTGFVGNLRAPEQRSGRVSAPEGSRAAGGLGARDTGAAPPRRLKARRKRLEGGGRIRSP